MNELLPPSTGLGLPSGSGAGPGGLSTGLLGVAWPAVSEPAWEVACAVWEVAWEVAWEAALMESEAAVWEAREVAWAETQVETWAVSAMDLEVLVAVLEAAWEA